MLVELAAELTRSGKELRLTGVHPPALAVLERAGVASRVPVDDVRDRITQSG